MSVLCGYEIQVCVKKEGGGKLRALLKKKTFLWKNIQVMKKNSYLDGIQLSADFAGISDSKASSLFVQFKEAHTLNTGRAD